MKSKVLFGLGTLILSLLLVTLNRTPLFAQSSFMFASGNASSSITDGAGPTTVGIGLIGSNDPVTTVGANHAIIISQNPAWLIIPGTQWISFDNTSFVGPPNGTTVSFTTEFFIPAGATNPNLTVSVLSDDIGEVFLNNVMIGFGAGFRSVSTFLVSDPALFNTGATPNILRFDVIQLGGDGFGLDYKAEISFVSTGVEDCTNGVDDNGNELVDCEDPGCSAHPACANNPPDCSGAFPSLLVICPDDRRMVCIDISGVTDLDGDPVTLTITGITQDEPVTEPDEDDDKYCPDGAGVGTSTAQVRAEEDGEEENGRVYVISFMASDGKGGECTGTVKVCVPHDDDLCEEDDDEPDCVDDGQVHDSTTCPCP